MPNKSDGYPPSPFHTYWTLKLFRVLEEVFKGDYNVLKKNLAKIGFDFDRIKAEMLAWAKETAGYEMALHAAQSSALDSDRLAWSLAILITFDVHIQADLGQQDFIRNGLKCLFEEQTNVGIWRTGGPLFHYKDAGNAHCYIFETFAALLGGSLHKDNSFLRLELRPYANQLLKLWRYAEITKLVFDGGIVVWSSGHRVNRKEPESWATASVYAYAQSLRRLVGIWTRDAAIEKLPFVPPRKTAVEAIDMLRDRGETWSKDENKSAVNQLMTLFILIRVQIETNNPRPRADAAEAFAVGGEAGQP